MDHEKPSGYTPEDTPSDKIKESKRKRRRRSGFRIPLETVSKKEDKPQKLEKSRDIAELLIGHSKDNSKPAEKTEDTKKPDESVSETVQEIDSKMPDTPELKELKERVRSALGAQDIPEKLEFVADKEADPEEEDSLEVDTVEAADLIKGGEELEDGEFYAGEAILSGVIYSREEEANSLVKENQSEPLDPDVIDSFREPGPVTSMQPTLERIAAMESSRDSSQNVEPEPDTSTGPTTTVAPVLNSSIPRSPNMQSVSSNVYTQPSVPMPQKQIGNTPPPQGPNPPYGARSPWNPNFQPPQPNTANVLPTPSASIGNTITQRDIDDAEYYGRKKGLGEGVATGLLVGGTYEHLKHKGREKKTEKRFNEQQKELEQTRVDNSFNLQEQVRKNDEMQRQLDGIDMRTQNVQTVEDRVMPQTEEVKPTQYQPPKFDQPRFEQPRTNLFEQQAPTSITRPEQTQMTEQNPVVNQEIPKPPRTEQQVQAGQVEQLDIPKDHRIETSAWHSIEVDAKTGKAVENPTFAYGEEYYHERAQETRSVDENGVSSQNTVTPRANKSEAIAIGVPLIPSQQPSGSSVQHGSLPPISNTPRAANQPASVRFKAKAKAGAQKAVEQATTPGSIWPMVAVLVVLVIIIAILI